MSGFGDFLNSQAKLLYWVKERKTGALWELNFCPSKWIVQRNNVVMGDISNSNRESKLVNLQMIGIKSQVKSYSIHFSINSLKEMSNWMVHISKAFFNSN